VGDSGFEPQTPSASRKYDSLQKIPRACEIPANRRILRVEISTFQDIRLRCCTDAAPLLHFYLLVVRPSLNALALF